MVFNDMHEEMRSQIMDQARLAAAEGVKEVGTDIMRLYELFRDQLDDLYDYTALLRFAAHLMVDLAVTGGHCASCDGHACDEQPEGGFDYAARGDS